MKIPFVILSLFSLLFLLSACPEKVGDEKPTKDSFENLVIEYYDGGGMLPVTEKFYISNDSACWFYQRFGGKTIISWIPKIEDLQDIYKTLIENDYANIKSTSEGEVYDRGGIILNFDIDGKSTEINNNGNSFVEKSKIAEYRNILQKIEVYVKGEVKKQLISIPVKIGNKINTSNFDLRVDLNDETVYQSYDDLVILPEKLLCYPGENRVECNMFYKDSLGYYKNKVSYFSEAYFIDVKSEADTLTLDIIGDKLSLDTAD